ncbi:MAG: NfeD family protein [Leptospirales bacterium]
MRYFKISVFVVLITTVVFSQIYSQGSGRGANANEIEKDLIFHILPHHIDQSEDQSYASFIMDSFRKADEEKASLIILEINTPGGELISTLEIKNIIFSASIPTVCFVNQNAYSAGSIIALSCDKVVMSTGSVIGATTPVYMKDGEMKKGSEKVISGTRAAIRSAAEAHGKPGIIAEAFVDDSIVLNKKEHGIDKPAGKLLTLTVDEAIRLNIADYKAESIEEIILTEGFVNFHIERAKPSYISSFLNFFLDPVVSGILIGLGVLGLFSEMKVPGWGVSGMFGITFISIFFITRIMAGYSGWEAPALFAFSLLLIFLEIFVIPGFGVAGIIGFTGMLGAIVWSFGIDNMEDGIIALAVSLVFIMTGMYLLIRLLPTMVKKGKGIFLSNILKKDSEKTIDEFGFLVGKTGTTATVLRPSGTIKIDDIKYDAVSEDGFIEMNVDIEVAYVEGSRIVVDKTEK